MEVEGEEGREEWRMQGGKEEGEKGGKKKAR